MNEVASFTDAWIETVLQNLSVKPPESHLLQMRGLKHVLFILKMVVSLSHLLQMRGLKLLLEQYKSNREVASFTDAWIETLKSTLKVRRSESHLLQMRGLKLLISVLGKTRF